MREQFPSILLHVHQLLHSVTVALPTNHTIGAEELNDALQSMHRSAEVQG